MKLAGRLVKGGYSALDFLDIAEGLVLWLAFQTENERLWLRCYVW